jgi:hypothetical protein
VKSLQSRVDALEQKIRPAIRLGVCVFLGESDDAAIRRTAAENGFAFDQIAAAVLFYQPECACPETPAWDAAAETWKCHEERCKRHEKHYRVWAAQVKPLKQLSLRSHEGVELRNFVSPLDALRVLNKASRERYDEFVSAVPMSSEDKERVTREWDEALNRWEKGGHAKQVAVSTESV